MQTELDLYLDFRSKKLTYNQLMARNFQRKGISDYVVLDDIKDKFPRAEKTKSPIKESKVVQ